MADVVAAGNAALCLALLDPLTGFPLLTATRSSDLESTAYAMTNVRDTASDLSKQAERLASEVKAFVAEVRAA